MQQLIGNVRTMFLFRGIAAILFGILTFVWPNLTLSVLVLLFGVFAVVSGITAVAAAVRNREEQGWGLLLFEGILGILAGVVAPLAFPMRGSRAALMVLAGLASIVFGILIAAQPSSGLLAVVWLIGVYAIGFGVMYVVAYFESRSLSARLA